MGGSGADPRPVDITPLSPRDQQVYRWACDEVAAGRYPSKTSIGRFLGVHPTRALRIRRRILAAVGWPCPLRRFPGAGPPRSLSLTPRQAEAHAWAVARHARGHSPSDVEMGRFLGVNYRRARYIRLAATRKVGWPYAVGRRRSGSLNLTPLQRAVLADAWTLWEGGEYPSLRVLSGLRGCVGRDHNWVMRARTECVTRGLWPCRVKSIPSPLSPEEREWVLETRASGVPHAEIPGRFRERWCRSVSSRTVQRICKAAGHVLDCRPRSPSSLEDRKAEVISDRGGFAPAKLQDPAAYRRALRVSRSREKSSRVRKVPSLSS